MRPSGWWEQETEREGGSKRKRGREGEMRGKRRQLINQHRSTKSNRASVHLNTTGDSVPTKLTSVSVPTQLTSLFVWFGSKRRINPCGSLASDGIKLNMMKMEKVKIYKIK